MHQIVVVPKPGNMVRLEWLNALTGDNLARKGVESFKFHRVIFSAECHFSST